MMKLSIYAAIILMAAIIGSTNAANCFEAVAGEGVKCTDDWDCQRCDNYQQSWCQQGTCTGTASVTRRKRNIGRDPSKRKPLQYGRSCVRWSIQINFVVCIFTNSLSVLKISFHLFPDRVECPGPGCPEERVACPGPDCSPLKIESMDAFLPWRGVSHRRC